MSDSLAERSRAMILQLTAERDALLQACKLALARMLQLGAEDEPGPESIGPCRACQAVRAAIAKAEQSTKGH